MTVLPLAIAAMTFADVAALTREEASWARDVSATGVVTQVVGWRASSGILADVANPNGRGIYFSGEPLASPDESIADAAPFGIGDVIEVRGVSTPFAFAPGIIVSSIKTLGRMELPPFRDARLSELRGGRLDNARVKLAGVLTGVRQIDTDRLDPDASIVQLSLNTEDGCFVAHVPGKVEDWRPLLDAELAVAGCAMSAYNIRAEFRGVQMEVASPSDISVMKPPPSSPFELKTTPVAELMAFSPRPGDIHAKLVSGVVTFVCAGESFFYIQDGIHGLKVTMDVPDGLSVGDSVDVAGFPISVDGCGELRGMAVRNCGKTSLPEPQCADLADYLRWQYYSSDGSMNDIVWRRMSFEARVVCAESDGDTSRLVVAVSNITCSVRLAGPLPDAFEDAQEMRPLARITAVAEPSVSEALNDNRQPVLKSLSFAAAPGDIEFLPDGEWRTRRVVRVLNIAAVAVGSLLALLIAAGVARIALDKRERERMAAITAERKRMAADMHDTLEQHLAGARMLMESSIAIAKDVPESVAAAVTAAGAALTHARTELRKAIFNLRCDEIFDRRPADVIREMVRNLERGSVAMRCRLRGLPQSLTPAVFADLVAIVQEAIANALKHGKAKTIAVVCDPADDGWTLRIANDGAPFDCAAALNSPRAGHFGLNGMRERAKRAGLTISWSLQDQWTVVTIEGKNKP